jgi:hypothetical protein
MIDVDWTMRPHPLGVGGRDKPRKTDYLGLTRQALGKLPACGHSDLSAVYEFAECELHTNL